MVTDGGSGQGRSALAAVRALAEGGYPVAVTTSGRYSLAAASKFTSRRVDVPSVADVGRYKEAILKETRSRPYLTVMATSDAALLALREPVRHLVDKVKLADAAKRVGIESPETVRFSSSESLMGSADDLDFPVVVKPAVSRWPAACVASIQDLASVARNVDGPVLVQPFLQQNMRAVCGVVWKGHLVAVSHQRYFRTWPATCGTASAAETTEPDLGLEEKLVGLLVGFDGIFQAQLAAGKLLDLNARPYGSMPLAVRAGANFPAIYCDLLHGVEYTDVVRARPGVFYRWVEGDVRNLFGALRRREIGVVDLVRAFRPHRRAAHSTELLSDPKPTLARLAYALRRAA